MNPNATVAPQQERAPRKQVFIEMQLDTDYILVNKSRRSDASVYARFTPHQDGNISQAVFQKEDMKETVFTKKLFASPFVPAPVNQVADSASLNSLAEKFPSAKKKSESQDRNGFKKLGSNPSPRRSRNDDEYDN